MAIKMFGHLRRRAELALLSWRSRPVVILMRYSILQAPENGGNAWDLGRDTTLDEVRAKLFDPIRLAQRLRALNNVVLPSLAKQSVRLNRRRHRLVVVTSDELPSDHMAALRAALAPYPWARIETCPVDRRPDYPGIVDAFLRETRASRGMVATVRLDDDDALGRRYIEKLLTHVTPENDGHAVTFPLGYIGLYDAETGTFSDFCRTRNPFYALGLAMVEIFDGKRFAGRTVYGLGDHTKIEARWPHIIDESIRAYIRTIYPEQDTAGRSAKMFKPQNSALRGDVAGHIGMVSATLAHRAR